MFDSALNLGSEIYERWRRVGFSRRVFGPIAYDVFQSFDLVNSELAERAENWLASATHYTNVPPHLNDEFAEPSLTIYSCPEKRFRLQLLFWNRHYRTLIHDHPEPLANVLLLGETLNVNYGFFAADETPDGRLKFGKLVVETLRTTKAGDAYYLDGGSESIHDVFHLTRRNVSLTARAAGESGTGYVYFSPGVALDFSIEVHPKFEKQRRFLDFLRRTDAQSARAFHTKLLERPDAEGASHFFRSLQEAGAGPDEIRTGLPTLARGASAHRTSLLESAAWDVLGRHQLGATRTDDVGARFFLTLLQTVGVGRRMFDLLAERYPQTPLKPQIGSWLAHVALREPLSPTLASYAIRAISVTDATTAEELSALENRFCELDRRLFELWNLRALVDFTGWEKRRGHG